MLFTSLQFDLKNPESKRVQRYKISINQSIWNQSVLKSRPNLWRNM